MTGKKQWWTMLVVVVVGVVVSSTPTRASAPRGDQLAPAAHTGVPDTKSMTDYDYDIVEALPDIPKDDEGFVQAFDLHETEDWLNFFHEYGIVVIKNILTDDACDRTVDEMWQALEGVGIMRDDPKTWTRMPWGAHMGFLGNNAAFSPTTCENRQSPRLYEFFRQLYDTDHLVVSIDRWGFMRPTKGLSVPGYKQPVDVPAWGTLRNWVHWDMNPFTGSASTYAYQGNYPENIHNRNFTRLKTQGTVALADASEQDGGFHAIPGFHKHIQAWGKQNWAMRRRFTYPVIEDETTMQVPYEDPIRQKVQTLPVRKGSLMVWNSAIPHGTFPNQSNRPRIVQYLKMAPVRDPAIVPAAVNSTSGHNTVIDYGPHMLPQGFDLTPLGERLRGFVEWGPNETAADVLGSEIEFLPDGSARV